jgi:hypothetical protein
MVAAVKIKLGEALSSLWVCNEVFWIWQSESVFNSDFIKRLVVDTHSPFTSQFRYKYNRWCVWWVWAANFALIQQLHCLIFILLPFYGCLLVLTPVWWIYSWYRTNLETAGRTCWRQSFRPQNEVVVLFLNSPLELWQLLRSHFQRHAFRPHYCTIGLECIFTYLCLQPYLPLYGYMRPYMDVRSYTIIAF